MRLAASASLLSAHDTSKENKTHKQRANLSRPDDIQFQRNSPSSEFCLFQQGRQKLRISGKDSKGSRYLNPFSVFSGPGTVGS